MVSRLSRIIVLGIVALIAVSTLTAGPALAAKKKGDPTLTVTPNPVAAYSTFAIAGCGYAAGQAVPLALVSPTASSSYGTTANSQGCISTSWTTRGSGSYTLEAFQTVNNKLAVVASVTFTVQ